MEGFVHVARCELKGSDRGLELGNIDKYSFLILEDDPDFIKEEVELWGLGKRFKAKIFRPRRTVCEEDWDVCFDLNDVFIELRDVEEAGELEYFV